MAPTTRSRTSKLNTLTAPVNTEAQRRKSTYLNGDKAQLISHAENPLLLAPTTSNDIKVESLSGDLNAPSSENALHDSTKKAKQSKRKRVSKVESVVDWDILPHGMGKRSEAMAGFDIVKGEDLEETKPRKKRATGKKDRGDAPLKVKKGKKHPYGLTPGISPYPDLVMPTPEACEEVHRLLKEAHDPDDKVKPPTEIPPPSMDVTGCGEVPDLLDALLRTMLSAATTRNNSNSSIKALGDKYGLRTVGLGKGSINWDAVHTATLPELIETIKRGGLAVSKGTNIKAVLEMIYKRNVEIRDALLEERKTGQLVADIAAMYDTQEQKDAQLARFDETLLCMDYVFEMSSDDAMLEMTKLPGVGVKTASCVILFNMQRPSFAVDTHVWRLCKWLGWVPESAGRDPTFSHCEVRVPDHLKYALHQLLIRHGMDCGRCRASTSLGSEDFQNANCVLEHLVKRTGKRKGPVDGKGAGKVSIKKKSSGKKGRNAVAKKQSTDGEESDVAELGEKIDDGEDSELSELEDIDDDDE